MSKQFRELSKKDVWENEQDILKEWKKEDILNETIENRKGKENWVFYDGPATANGKPGIHHMVAKFLKDAFCKYKTMQGKRVLRKIGWDTHGLPVEVQVEKELGFNGKKDIFMDFINTSNLGKYYGKTFEEYGITHVILYKNAKIRMLIDEAEPENYNKIYSDNNFVIYEVVK